MVMTLHET